MLVDAYVLDLGGVDVISGIAWLENVGRTTIDWRKKTISSEDHSQTVLLQDYHLHEHPWTPALQGMLQRLTLEDSIPTWPSDPELPLDLQHALSSHESVFFPWQDLPLRHDYDHSITLLPDTNPVSMQPYIYAYHHKDKIERQVEELLTEGIIRHSISPFSSPIILVKKKDDSWRMCVDFRALNKVTVLDKYPIPTINELHDSRIFSKLDLKSGFH